MDLSPYLESLRRDLAAAAAPGGDHVAHTAELLTTALDASARLCLIEVLADASAEITSKLDGQLVEVRLRGREADLAVSPSPHDMEPEPTPPPQAVPIADSGETARLTLRLPEQLKDAVEQAAAAEGISVNAWLTRAAQSQLRGPAPRMQPPAGFGKRITGFAQA